RSAERWDEELIDERTAELTTALLETWPVPTGHEGKVVDRSSRLTKSSATYADLTAAGLLDVGTVLVCTHDRWRDARCEVLAGGQVQMGDKIYATPAAAAREVRGGRSGNAWYFWKVEGGPTLNTLRDRLLNEAALESASTPG